MSDPKIRFHVTGPESAALAEELAKVLGETFPDWPAPSAYPAQASSEEGEVQRGAAETMMACALFLAIPSAVDATWNLAERMKLGERVKRLVEWARRHRSARTDATVRMELPGGRATRLDDAEVEDVVNALAELHRQNKNRTKE